MAVLRRSADGPIRPVVNNGWRTLAELLNVEAEAWQADAVCAQTDPDSFYPARGGSTKAAKLVCSGCPVIEECLEFALEHEERHGVWGGLSERERRKIETDRRQGWTWMHHRVA